MEHYVTLFDSAVPAAGAGPARLAAAPCRRVHVCGCSAWTSGRRAADAAGAAERVAAPLVERGNRRSCSRSSPGAASGEYCWTLTPFTPRFVFEPTRRCARVTYLDADLWFLKTRRRSFASSSIGDAVLITDHAYAPEYDQSADVRPVLRAVHDLRPRRAASRCASGGRSAASSGASRVLEDGKFGDQKYLDDWPYRFAGLVHVLAEQELGPRALECDALPIQPGGLLPFPWPADPAGSAHRPVADLSFAETGGPARLRALRPTDPRRGRVVDRGRLHAPASGAAAAPRRMAATLHRRSATATVEVASSELPGLLICCRRPCCLPIAHCNQLPSTRGWSSCTPVWPRWGCSPCRRWRRWRRDLAPTQPVGGHAARGAPNARSHRRAVGVATGGVAPHPSEDVQRHRELLRRVPGLGRGRFQHAHRLWRRRRSRAASAADTVVLDAAGAVGSRCDVLPGGERCARLHALVGAPSTAAGPALRRQCCSARAC